ncbi:MAG: type II CAAX endopeptidase family protein [Lentimicrobiaceae bacterium]|nr:type II CAAX endopeptidase family protein [Lentimicrobiaceae bacterium]
MNPVPVFGNLSHRAKVFALLIILLLGTLIGTAMVYLFSVLVWGKDALNGLISEDPQQRLNMLRMAQIISQLFIFILPVFLFAWLTEQKPLRTLGFIKPRGRLFIVALLIIPLAGPMINELIHWNEALHLPQSFSGLEAWMKSSEENAAKLTEDFLSATGWKTLWINLLMIGILPALGEELLFRPVMIGMLRKYFRAPHWPVIISSLIFSAIHLQFFGFLPRFVLGLILGYLYVWSGSVWLPMIAHFVNNGSAVIISFLYYNHFINTSPEAMGETSGMPLVMLSAMLTAGLLLITRQQGISVSPRGRKL